MYDRVIVNINEVFITQKKSYYEYKILRFQNWHQLNKRNYIIKIGS
jgi:hypothetical protein